jgi:PPOX class probable F420-dependent enzyme
VPETPRWLDRVMRAQWRMFDAVRHPDAQRAVEQPGRTGPFEKLGDAGYCLFATFKRSGEPVPTPLLFSQRDGKVFVRTGPDSMKVRRLRRDPRARLARSTFRGRPRSPTYEGCARLLEGDEARFAHRALWDGYSLAARVYEGAVDRLPVEVAYIEVAPVR